jgi:hypothetical protein
MRTSHRAVPATLHADIAMKKSGPLSFQSFHLRVEPASGKMAEVYNSRDPDRPKLHRASAPTTIAAPPTSTTASRIPV